MENNASQLIQGLMSDPEMAGKLRGLLQSLGSGEGSRDAEETETAVVNEPPPAQQGDIDFTTISKIQNVYQKLNTTDDPRLSLLTALKPYLNSRRLGKMDQAMKILKFSKLSSVLGDLDIL